MKKRWTYKKLEECSYVQNGFAFNSKLFNSNKNGTPLVRIRDIKRGFSNTYTTESCEKEYNVENGDLLIGMDGDFNVCIWNGGFSYLNQRVCHVVTSNEILSRFLYYYLPFPLNKINEKTSYSTVKHLSSKQIYNIITPVPPLSEQQAIVSRLDTAFAKIDALKANAEREIQEAKSLFQKALSEAMIPKEGWERKKFGEVCTFVRGPFGGSLKKNCFKKSGYAVYEQQNAIYNRFTFRYFIDEKKYREMERFSIQSGDLIMSCSGTIGKVAIIPDEAAKGIINQALLKLSPKKNINRWYLKYLMESSFFKKMIQANSDGAAIKNIASVAVLKDLLLKIPPLSEQQAIVTHLDTLSEKLKTVEEKQKAVMAECDAMKQALLREVFE